MFLYQNVNKTQINYQTRESRINVSRTVRMKGLERGREWIKEKKLETRETFLCEMSVRLHKTVRAWARAHASNSRKSYTLLGSKYV